MNLKVVLLLLLLLFSASTVMIALTNTDEIPSHFKPMSFTVKFSNIQPTGGEAIDDPTAT